MIVRLHGAEDGRLGPKALAYTGRTSWLRLTPHSPVSGASQRLPYRACREFGIAATILVLTQPSTFVVCVPKTSSGSCDQAIFVDQAVDASVSSDAVLFKIDRLGQRFQRRGAVRGPVRAVLIVVGLFDARGSRDYRTRRVQPP